MINFLLYYHKERGWVDYIRSYSCLKQMEEERQCQTDSRSLPQQNAHKEFAELPVSLRKLLFFAKPDVVICLDDGIQPTRPIFAIEVSAHVMARDHWMQRFPYLVGCAQEGVPGAYIMPGAEPLRPNFPGAVDPLFYYAYDRVMEIHQTPFFIAEWKSTDGRTLDRDGEFNDKPDHESHGLQQTFRFLNLVIQSAIHGREPSALMRERLIVDLRDEIRRSGYNKLPRIKDFERLKFNMPEGKFLTSNQLREWIESKGLRLPDEIPDRIKKRERNLIYVPQSQQKPGQKAKLRKTLRERIAKKSGDPYTGQPLVFDYIFCRLGRTPYERDANLIVDLSVLKFSDLASYHHDAWKKSPLQHTQFQDIEHIPTYTMHLTHGFTQAMKNFLRLYAFTADVIVFRDGVIYF